MPERNGPYRGFPPSRPPRQIDDHDSISVGGASYYAGRSGRAKVKLPGITELSRSLTAKGGARSICVFRCRHCGKLVRLLARRARAWTPPSSSCSLAGPRVACAFVHESARPTIHCRCRIRALQNALRTRRGVTFAHLGESLLKGLLTTPHKRA